MHESETGAAHFIRPYTSREPLTINAIRGLGDIDLAHGKHDRIKSSGNYRQCL